MPGARAGGAGALSSPEAMADILKTRPVDPREDAAVWEKLTTLQKAVVEKEFPKKLAEWEKKHQYQGRKVTWDLKLDDVVPTEGQGFILKARSERGFVISALMPQGAMSGLLKLKKGDPIRLSGTIHDYRLKKRSGPFGEDESAEFGLSLVKPELHPVQ